MKKAILSTFITLTLLAGCTKSTTSPEADITAVQPFTVYTVNYPLAYFADRIGKEAANIVFPMNEEDDPAFWQPHGDTISAYQSADLILLNGAGYAKWVPMATLPESRLVNTSSGFPDAYLKADKVIAHQHGPEGPHDHGDVQFTTWMDFTLAAQQAEAIAQALTKAVPEKATDIDARLRALKEDLNTLDISFQETFDQMGPQPLLASHPVYGYFAQRYDLNLHNLHWEPDVMPDEAEWAALEDTLKSHPAQIMLWEDTPLPETKIRLETMGIKTWVVPPCGNRPSDGDLLSNLQAAAKQP